MKEVIQENNFSACRYQKLITLILQEVIHVYSIQSGCIFKL